MTTAKNTGILVFLRHGESRWNRENLFTGLADPDLTPEGEGEARRAAGVLQQADFKPRFIFTSKLRRAVRTAQIVAGVLRVGQECLTQSDQLNERDYGLLSGLNKEDAKARFGVEQVQRWRRSFEDRPPHGESLRETADRVVDYWTRVIRPRLEGGCSVLIVAHGNSLRALTMHLEGITPEEIEGVTIETCEPIIYLLRGDGQIDSKTVLKKSGFEPAASVSA